MDTSKKVITIAYCGPAVDNGTMDVRDLAPALLALSDFIRDANKIINDDDSQVSVRVNADFAKGSFEIQLDVIKTIAQKLQSLWNDSGMDAESILALLGLSVAVEKPGLIDLIKKIGGRVIESIIKSTEQPGKSLISFKGDNNIIIVDSKVADLYQSPRIRQNIGKVISPLKKEGINAFEVRGTDSKGNKTVKKVTKEDSGYFEIQECSLDMQNVSRQIVWVKLLDVSFEDLKWRISLGDAKMHATLTDENFKKQIDQNEIWFGKGDMLKIILEITQNIKPDGEINNQYSISKVEEIRHPKRETRLPF